MNDERPDPTRALLGKPTSCVGREGELAVLETRFAECEAGSGPKVLLVTAPEGAGKSRLRHEFVRRLLGRPTPPMVLLARGDSLRLSTPYAMAAEIVRQAVGVREPEPVERLQRRLAEHVSQLLTGGDAVRVIDFLGEVVSASFDDRGDEPLRAARGDANAMADQIRGAFEDIVRAWSARRPVMIVLEDLQWSDVASIKLLDGTLRKLAGAPVFVFAVARPEVHERVPGLFGGHDMTEIRLPPLSRWASVKLVEEVLGREVRGDEAAHIVQRAEGNAFYLEELIRAVPIRDDLPETVIAVAQARLDRLEPEVRKVVRGASVYGDVFWLEGVAALVGEHPAAIEPVIATLIEHEAVTESDPPRLAGAREFAFRHTLLREAAYATLSDQDRIRGHGIAAEWLQELGEDIEVVALHWLAAGDPSQAAECFAKAAEARLARAQADAAARCALRALLVRDASPRAVSFVATCIRLLATTLKVTRSLDYREAIVGLERHVRTGAVADGAQLVRMAVNRAVASIRGRCRPHELTPILADAGRALAALSAFSDANELLEEARTAAGDDESLLRHARWAAARVAFWDGEYGTTWETLSQTMLPDDRRERLEALLMLATAVVCVHGREALNRGLDFVGRAEALLSAPKGTDLHRDSLRDDPVARVHCARARASCFYFTGEYETGAECMEEAIELARRAGLRFEECANMHNIGEQRLRTGDRDGAREATKRSNLIARDLGFAIAEYHNAVLLAYLDGRPDDLSILAKRTRESRKPWRELHAQYWLGRLLAERAVPEARDALERAVALATALPVRTMADECIQLLAKLPAK
jgi:tetratricopeptide (TPR) repeat protein